jgi:response regulator NasT
MTKILVVDDDLVVLATINLGLRRAGYEVFQVDGGEPALGIARRERPDLALLDISMPGLNGIEVARVLKREIKVPFIFLTALSDKDIVAEAAQTGALGYLVKPLEISRIVPAIELALMRADEFSKLTQENFDLNEALNRNREIDVAIGIVMERHHLSRADAFEAMRRYARSHRCKIIELGDRLINGERINLALKN